MEKKKKDGPTGGGVESLPEKLMKRRRTRKKRKGGGTHIWGQRTKKNRRSSRGRTNMGADRQGEAGRKGKGKKRECLAGHDEGKRPHSSNTKDREYDERKREDAGILLQGMRWKGREKKPYTIKKNFKKGGKGRPEDGNLILEKKVYQCKARK